MLVFYWKQDSKNVPKNLVRMAARAPTTAALVARHAGVWTDIQVNSANVRVLPWHIYIQHY